MSKTFTLLASLALSLGTAHADKQPRVALTVSPVHLLLPMGELTAELRIADRIGVAAVVGAGSVSDEPTGARIGIYEGGASLRSTCSRRPTTRPR
jgi:hypothetical protein